MVDLLYDVIEAEPLPQLLSQFSGWVGYTLARHQVPGAPGKLKPTMTWAEGSLDEALAAVPPEYFERAVATLRRSSAPAAY